MRADQNLHTSVMQQNGFSKAGVGNVEHTPSARQLLKVTEN